MLSWVGTIAILVHLVVVLLHGEAHKHLGVELNFWQTAYAAIVIVAGPLSAAPLLWTRHARLGFLLLVISMAGSLSFGVYYHFIAISVDHVSHLPPGDAQGLFRLTALLLAATEVFGVACGLYGLRHVRSRD
jgi:hypothetical protein